MARSAAELEAHIDVKLVASSNVPAPMSAAERLERMVDLKGMYHPGTLLLDVRDRVSGQKSRLDSFDEVAYRRARDHVFPLAHSGVSDRRARFMNRAGHKLNQVMDGLGVWDSVSVRRPPGGAAAATDASAAEDGDTVRDALARVRRRRQLAFADICGGPGAFSQALFQTAPKKMKVRGFGLTLMDKHVGADHGWYPQLLAQKNFAVTFGIDGTGDIYKPATVECFASMAAAAGGVQLAVGDGGFEMPPAQQNVQEAFSARIVFAQWYVALRVMDIGGALVLKLFDTFTDFTRSVLFLSCFAFDDVHIVKPLHSRAVNGERYLACLGYRGLSDDWMAYLEDVHAHGWTETRQLQSLVKIDEMRADAAFEASVNASITAVAEVQVAALQLVLDSPLLHEAPPQQPEAQSSERVPTAGGDVLPDEPTNLNADAEDDAAQDGVAV